MIFLTELKNVFSYPINKDFVVREIYMKSLNSEAALLYLKGMADFKLIEIHRTSIIETPLFGQSL